jgi:hypothetical protein
MTWTKNNVLKSTTIFAQGYFTFGPAIEVVEDCRWQTAASQGTKILDAYDTRRCDGLCRLLVQGAPRFLTGKVVAAGRKWLSQNPPNDQVLQHSFQQNCNTREATAIPVPQRKLYRVNNLRLLLYRHGPFDYLNITFGDGLSPCPMISFAEVPAVP